MMDTNHYIRLKMTKAGLEDLRFDGSIVRLNGETLRSKSIRASPKIEMSLNIVLLAVKSSLPCFTSFFLLCFPSMDNGRFLECRDRFQSAVNSKSCLLHFEK